MTITQQVFNTDDVYVSIYDRPKRGKGRPKSSLTDEEKAQKKRDNYKRWYAENSEYVLLKKKLIREAQRNTN
mgnify:CR=1 FL=1